MDTQRGFRHSLTDLQPPVGAPVRHLFGSCCPPVIRSVYRQLKACLRRVKIADFCGREDPYRTQQGLQTFGKTPKRGKQARGKGARAITPLGEEPTTGEFGSLVVVLGCFRLQPPQTGPPFSLPSTRFSMFDVSQDDVLRSPTSRLHDRNSFESGKQHILRSAHPH